MTRLSGVSFHFLANSLQFTAIEEYFNEQVDEALREVYLEIEKRYEIKFLEIGVDKDHIGIELNSAEQSPTLLVFRTVVQCQIK